MTTSLIVGATGQTGAYLARALIRQGHEVIATSRNWNETNPWRFKRLGVLDSVQGLSLSPSDTSGIRATLERSQPDEIYYLAGPSSVAASFHEPTATLHQIVDPIVAFLDALRSAKSSARFFNAASSDCFGFQPLTRLTEESSFRPRSPYAVAKSAAFWNVKNYRDAFGLKASNGILTNHESPLRGDNFVTQKIIKGLLDVASGRISRVTLGATGVSRDWLWAGDVAEAITQINRAAQPSDYVVASGKSSTLQEFIQLACRQLELEPEDVIEHDRQLFRPTDIDSISLDPAKILRDLGWQARHDLKDIVMTLLAGEIDPISSEKA